MREFFRGCNYDCLNCQYSDCLLPAELCEKHYTIEEQLAYLERRREQWRKYNKRRYEEKKGEQNAE